MIGHARLSSPLVIELKGGRRNVEVELTYFAALHWKALLSPESPAQNKLYYRSTLISRHLQSLYALLSEATVGIIACANACSSNEVKPDAYLGTLPRGLLC
ncbi:hypothetical protein V6N12_062062 [Hibiscus sabdariffa]|uniref:Uncharacterized protein n=1 Tax=Hibiscus sabdariffa TaxID=183260 RepID=A0ABR2A6X1_9ROSI